MNITTRGLTAIEALVVLAIFVVISGVVMSIVSSFYQYNAYTIAQSYQVQNGRIALERLVRDAREMTFADTGAFPLIAYSTSSLSFYSDVDGDQSVEKVRYELSDEELVRRLYRATGTPPVYDSTPYREQTIARHIQNNPDDIDLFTYTIESGEAATSTTPATSIRHIDIRVKVSVDPARNPNEFEIRSSATLRNIESAL